MSTRYKVVGRIRVSPLIKDVFSSRHHAALRSELRKRKYATYEPGYTCPVNGDTWDETEPDSNAMYTQAVYSQVLAKAHAHAHARAPITFPKPVPGERVVELVHR